MFFCAALTYQGQPKPSYDRDLLASAVQHGGTSYELFLRHFGTWQIVGENMRLENIIYPRNDHELGIYMMQY